MVTIYTLPACVQCESTKRYLAKKGVEFQEVSMDQNIEALEKIKEMGYSQAPVVVAGESTWSGFRLDSLQKLV